MWIEVADAKSNETYKYHIPDAPVRLFMTEETQRIPSRFVYTISKLPLEHATEISFSDFIPILFFDLAFEPISPELWQWIDALTS